MKKTFTPEYIYRHRGCYETESVDDLSFIGQKEISIETLIKSEMPLKDKFWFVLNKCKLTTRQKQEIAIGCTEIVLEIYEANYDNKVPRNATQAARDYLNGTIDIEEVLILARIRTESIYALAITRTIIEPEYDYAYAVVYIAINISNMLLFTDILLKYLIDFIERN